MKEGYLTTFQAADLLSVTPDSILKWIKSGRLKARRTPGGHHRISRNSIDAIQNKSNNVVLSEELKKQKEFLYCWEFNKNKDGCVNNCEKCVVFKIQAKRCYKMSNFPSELGHLKRFCKSSCDDCEYYKFVKSSN